MTDRTCRLYALAILLLTLQFAAACGQNKTAAQGPAGPGGFAAPVRVEEAKVTSVDETSEYTAVIKSRHSVTVQPDVEGKIVSIAVKSGDRVAKGAPILEIDPLKQAATVTSQQSAREAQVANLEWARTELERRKRLFAAGVVSKQDLDQAQTAYDAAKSQLQALEAQVKEQQVQLRYHDVTAPTAGIVGDVPVHVGDRVTEQTVLTTVDQSSGLEAYINIPAERAPQLRMGAPVELLDGNGNLLSDTRVTFISPQVDTATQSVLVKAAITNPKQRVRPAQLVRARITWSSHQGLVVPVLSVSRVSGQHFAFVAEQSGQQTVARQRPLKVGEIVGNDYVVLEGIKAGEKVVVSGSQNLVDGMPVNIAR